MRTTPPAPRRTSATAARSSDACVSPVEPCGALLGAFDHERAPPGVVDDPFARRRRHRDGIPEVVVDDTVGDPLGALALFIDNAAQYQPSAPAGGVHEPESAEAGIANAAAATAAAAAVTSRPSS
jgi:hypothetical protein